MDKRLDVLRRKIRPVVKEYGVRRVGLFGSFARGETRRGSDIDLLVDIGKSISLLDFVGLKLRLEDALGRKVDLVEYGTLKPRLRESILKEQVVLI